jgi:hypothetical protein
VGQMLGRGVGVVVTGVLTRGGERGAALAPPPGLASHGRPPTTQTLLLHLRPVGDGVWDG